MNLRVEIVARASRPRCRAHGRDARATTCRFMGRPHAFFVAHWDHEPLTAWSPGFSRPKPFEPPKGGTPNKPRFMESLHSLLRMHWDHEPEFHKSLNDE